jgi:hypothetical protein
MKLFFIQNTSVTSYFCPNILNYLLQTPSVKYVFKRSKIMHITLYIKLCKLATVA